MPPSAFVRSRPCSRTASSAMFAGLLLAAAGVCQAQPIAPADPEPARLSPSDSTHAVGVRIGNHGAYRNASLFWQTPAFWTHTFDQGGRLDLIGEAALTAWRAQRGEPRSLWQAEVAPILRWWPSSGARYYLEAGAGLTYVSRTDLAGYHLSTALQFGTHVGAGYVFNKRHQVGLRFSHYSNARIKRPNNGLNVVQLEYAMHF